ncbi:MAG: LysR family transcriptional regulator [Pseudolabrys sp.]
MDFRQLQYFAAAVEQRSLSAAARICRVTQPTLSAQMQRLETELNDVLFTRTPVGLQPTKSAQRLYRRVSPLLDDAAHGARYIRSGSSEPIQPLPVSVDYSPASLLMQLARQAAQALEAEAPYVKVTLSDTDNGVLRLPAVRLRHVAAEPSIRAPTDQWLLVALRSQVEDGDDGPRHTTLDGVIDVPVLPAPIHSLLQSTRTAATLRFHTDEPADLLASLLTQNRGPLLVPRLAVNPESLRHPRLSVRVVTEGLPALAVIADCADHRDATQNTFRRTIETLIESCLRDPVATAPPSDAMREPLPDTRQIRYFLRVCDEGGITRAAAKLNVVQPAVSMQIRTLERSLGGKLFDRSAQGIHLTPFGRKVRAVYSPILDMLQTAGQAAPATHRRPAPVMRVGVLPGLDEDSLLVQATTATIVQWRKTFANVELKIVESHSGVLLDWLADNVIDIAIVEDMHAHRSLKETVLGSEPLSILTASRPVICPPGPIKMTDIGKLDLVLPSARHGLRALLERKFADVGLPLVPKLELDSMAAAVRLVKSGGWATVMPSSAVQRSLDNHILTAHPIIKPAIMRELRAVQLPRHRKRPWEGEFIAFLRARLSSQLTA